MIAPMDEQMCPCGSDTPLGECCQPIIEGDRSASTAEALMRSRYSAYVLGEIDYIVDTTHSEVSESMDREEAQRWSSESEWLGLTIHDTEDGQTGDDAGTVTFTAKYRYEGKVHTHRERSSFLREDGRWKFHSVLGDGTELELVAVQPRSEVGRNDPCPCGSGKKYKRCHG